MWHHSQNIETNNKEGYTIEVPQDNGGSGTSTVYGSESWVMNRRSSSRIKSVEMKFLRRTKGCTKLDHIKNEEIKRELEFPR